MPRLALTLPENLPHGQFCKLHDELSDFFSTTQKAQLAPSDDVSRIFETFECVRFEPRRVLLRCATLFCRVQLKSLPDRLSIAHSVDHSNAIESRELLAALRSLWLPHIDAIEATQIFNRYDADGNGRLDADEFRRLVEDLRAYVRSTRS